MPFKGRENVYMCQTCGKPVTTIDRDEGVTPFMIGCKVTPGCPGPMYSSFYPEGPRPKSLPEPTYEWYMPSETAIAKRDKANQEYHRNGAMALRRIEGTGEITMASGDPAGYYRDHHGSLRRVK